MEITKKNLLHHLTHPINAAGSVTAGALTHWGWGVGFFVLSTIVACARRAWLTYEPVFAHNVTLRHVQADADDAKKMARAAFDRFNGPPGPAVSPPELPPPK